MVFQLLVSGSGWASSSDTMPKARVFEHTEDELEKAFNVETTRGRQLILDTPALLMPETGRSNQFANVTRINRVRVQGTDVLINYTYDSAIDPIPLARVRKLQSELGISDWEFSRTHWAIKDADLYRALLLEDAQPRYAPKVFRIEDIEEDEDLVAVMMPFDASYDEVFKSIRAAAKEAGYKCKRADDIWEDSVLIQDVVSLISQAAIVVCDCTARNPNVFYEAGIAHSIGREVVLLSQAKSDIPFDLQHHRFLNYLNNGEGRTALQEKLARRLKTLRERARR